MPPRAPPAHLQLPRRLQLPSSSPCSHSPAGAAGAVLVLAVGVGVWVRQRPRSITKVTALEQVKGESIKMVQTEDRVTYKIEAELIHAFAGQRG